MLAISTSIKRYQFHKERHCGWDFNVVLSSKDPFCESMEDLIADWDLVDVKPLKGKYT